MKFVSKPPAPMSFLTIIKNTAKIVEQAVVIKDAIQERDKRKAWRAIKESPIHTFGYERWKAAAPKLGDHIKVRRLGYTHHGIYISKNEVIHFTGRDNDNLKDWKHNRIMATTLDEFLKGGKLLVRQYTIYEQRHLRQPLEIMTIARQFIGQDGYNLFLNNCEHFCNVCTFNKKYSKQVDRWTNALVRIFDSIIKL